MKIIKILCGLWKEQREIMKLKTIKAVELKTPLFKKKLYQTQVDGEPLISTKKGIKRVDDLITKDASDHITDSAVEDIITPEASAGIDDEHKTESSPDIKISIGSNMMDDPSKGLPFLISASDKNNNQKGSVLWGTGGAYPEIHVNGVIDHSGTADIWSFLPVNFELGDATFHFGSLGTETGMFVARNLVGVSFSNNGENQIPICIHSIIVLKTSQNTSPVMMIPMHLPINTYMEEGSQPIFLTAINSDGEFIKTGIQLSSFTKVDSALIKMIGKNLSNQVDCMEEWDNCSPFTIIENGYYSSGI